MASTRYSQQPLQIYQDPVESFDHAPMPSMQNPSTKKSSPLRPIKNAASRRNIVFNPPQAGPRKNTPLKPAHQTSSSPSRAPFNSKLNAVSMPPPGGPIYNTDSMEKKPLMSKFKPQKALFTTFPSTKSMDKENYDQSAYHQTCDSYGEGFDGSNFSLEGFYGQKPPQKRMLMDAAPIHDLRPFKKSKLEETIEGEELPEQLELPSPDSFPPIHDDGNKPPLSYAQLIGTSILRSPARRLTLAQIYKWISDNFSFYSATDAGWQNSIRHNLSLNKAFHKQERPKDDPGKGNYWAILPGMEHQFIKDKTVRKGTSSNETVSLLSTSNMSMNEQETLRHSYKQIVPAPQELPLPPQSSYTVPDTQLSTLPELSSDATIPASDAFAPEELDEVEELPPSSPLINSSPPAMMHSSPPVPRHSTRTHNTPPAVPLFPSSSRSRSHKRKFASMDDSGYFSSLDSSAMRPHQVGRFLTSEIDRPRMKRGRAEEEIARIRGSSYDSPPKGRLPNFAPPSSSPLRRNPKHDSQMLPPLTPAMKLKAPVRPPLSASPNTNLKAHRDRVRAMVGSPERGMSSLSEELLPWSPAFNLDDTTTYHLDLFAQECDIFNSSLLMVPGTGSPEKRSAKRPRIERSRSANILADITNSNSGNRTANATPNLKFSQTLMASAYNSPIKGLGIMESPSTLLGINSPSIMISPALDSRVFDLPQDEFIGSEFLSEEVADFSGVDLTQGFQKIGSGAHSSRNTPNGNNSRPAFGRSFTSRF